MAADDIPAHIALHCPRRPTHCSNKGCEVVFEYGLRMYHENGDCLYTLLLCPQVGVNVCSVGLRCVYMCVDGWVGG